MKDAVGAGDRVAHGDTIGDIADHQFGRFRRIVAMAGGKVVEDTDLVTLGEQGIRKMRADEAAPAGNQISRHENPVSVLRRRWRRLVATLGSEDLGNS